MTTNNQPTPDQQRVCDYIQKLTNGQVGCGDDPIGWLLADHARLYARVREEDNESAVMERLNELIDKYKWQVRDTCARAEKAEGLLRAANKAINPPDKKGISLATWNQRLKCITAQIRRYFTSNMAANVTVSEDELREVKEELSEESEQDVLCPKTQDNPQPTEAVGVDQTRFELAELIGSHLNCKPAQPDHQEPEGVAGENPLTLEMAKAIYAVRGPGEPPDQRPFDTLPDWMKRLLIAQARAARDRFDKCLSRVIKDCDKLTEQADQLQKERDEARALCAAQDKRYRRLEKERGMYQDRVIALGRLKAGFQDAAAEYKAERDQLQAKNEKLQAQCDRLEDGCHELSDKLSMSENQRLKTENEKLEAALKQIILYTGPDGEPGNDPAIGQAARAALKEGGNNG